MSAHFERVKNDVAGVAPVEGDAFVSVPLDGHTAVGQRDNDRVCNIDLRGKWSIYEHWRARVADGKIEWVESVDTVSIIDVVAGSRISGRELLQWLVQQKGKQMDAVGVTDAAEGFWDRMEEEGLITAWCDQNFVDYFCLRTSSRPRCEGDPVDHGRMRG